MQIAVEGLIGVGKSTFVKKFTEITGFSPLYESVDDNPFLSLFYEDPKRWAYTLQSYFLYRRYSDHLVGGDVVLDRSLYGDISFADMLVKDKTLSFEEHNCYLSHYETLEPLLPSLTAVIFLNATPESALSRLRHRARSFEVGVDLSYLRGLEYEIRKIPSRLRKETQVIDVEWGDMTEEEIELAVKRVVLQVL
jgi:deoxyguanosine kinase